MHFDWQNLTSCFASTPEVMGILNIYFPRVRIELTICNVYSHILVYLRHDCRHIWHMKPVFIIWILITSSIIWNKKKYSTIQICHRHFYSEVDEPRTMWYFKLMSLQRRRYFRDHYWNGSPKSKYSSQYFYGNGFHVLIFLCQIKCIGLVIMFLGIVVHCH